ncbi:MAG: lipopolysaccharide biosynthesis protein [bacterium]
MGISKSKSSNAHYFNTDHIKSNLKKLALKGAGATVFSQISVYGIQMIGTIVLARLLTPNDFGLMTMVTSISLLLRNFGTRGFTEATIQSEVISHNKISTLFWIHIALCLILTLIFVILSPLIAWFYKEPQVKSIAIIIAFSFIFSALSTQHLALLNRNMQFYRIATIEIFAATISTITAIALALQGWGYWALVARRTALPAAIAAGAWIFCRWLPGLPSRGTGVRSMLKFGMNTYGNFTMNYFSRNLDKILIGWHHGSQSLGFYEKAYYLFVMPVSQLSYPLTNVAVASLSRLRDNPEDYRRYYLKALSMLAFIGMILSAILTLIGKDLILLLLGPQWNRTGEIFSVFGPCIGILLIYGTHGWLHLSLGRADRWFRWGIIEFITTAIAFVIGLPFGALVVALTYTISFYILFVPGLWYAGRPIHLKLSSLISAIWKYYLTALIAGLLCWFILYSFGLTSNIFIRLNIFFRIFITIIIFLFLYLLLILAFYQNIEPISQFISLVHKMVPSILSKISKVNN